MRVAAGLGVEKYMREVVFAQLNLRDEHVMNATQMLPHPVKHTVLLHKAITTPTTSTRTRAGGHQMRPIECSSASSLTAKSQLPATSRISVVHSSGYIIQILLMMMKTTLQNQLPATSRISIVHSSGYIIQILLMMMKTTHSKRLN